MRIIRSSFLLGLSAAALSAPLPSRADDAGPVTALDAVTATATRSPESLNDLPGTVSVIDQTQLEEQNVQSPADAVRYEPGVSVGNQPFRGGLTNYEIRGIGDNRVLLLIDGIAVPDFPETNLGAGTYTRNFVDLDALKQIDIVRGPASALYGSDAIGGVVAYVTKDPADFLAESGRDWYLSGKTGFTTAGNSFTETATGAARSGPFDVMMLFTRRDGNQIEPNGSMSANPQNDSANNFLGKIVYHVSAVDTFRLTAEWFQREVDTNVLTDLGTVPGFFFPFDPAPAPTTTTFDSRAQDTTNRNRISLEYIHDAPIAFIDRTQARIYFTSLDLTEHEEQRLIQVYPGPADDPSLPPVPWPADPSARYSDFRFLQNVFGGSLQFDTARTLFGVPNYFTYGVDVSQTSTSHPRDRFQVDLVTGARTNTVDYETFPDKNFPDTTTTKMGFYVQDRIVAGRLTLLPGVRIDYYHLEPYPDAAFENSNLGTPIRAVTAVPVSPKFGLTYKLTDEYTLFGQYAHGFRAPPYDDANFGFRNPQYFYEILPSPNLKPESSDGVEAGLRGRFHDGSSFGMSAFYNKYRDFIDAALVGIAPDGVTEEFQYVNLSQVTIYGAEARGEWRFLPSWSLIGSAAYARGQDDVTHLPIDTVDPFKVITGLRYADPSGKWGGELVGTHTWRHDRVSDPTFFRAPSYTTLDLMVHDRVTPNLTVNAGIFNITNAKYFVSADVVGVASNSPLLGLYAQPGTTFAVNASYRW